MIKKISIKNYGPFKETEINLNNNSFITILGRNDVGKTCLLSLLNWVNDDNENGLINKYINYNNDGKKIDLEAAITYNIKLTYSHENIPNEFKNIDLDFIIKTQNGIFNKSRDSSILFSDSGTLLFFEKFITFINSKLTNENKIIEQNAETYDLSDEKIGSIIKNIKNKTRNTENKNSAIELLNFLLEIKNDIYNCIYKKTEFLSTSITSDFRIRETYDLRDEKQRLEITRLLKIFLGNEFADCLKIFNSDLDNTTREIKIQKMENVFSENIKHFFDENFINENFDLGFFMKYDYQNRNFKILCKDHTSNFISLNKKSDGFKWFLNLFISLKTLDSNSILIIDEPERFLHPAAQKSLIELIEKAKTKNQNIQVIFAMHSPFLLKKDFFPSCKIISKSNNASHIYNNISSFINNNENFKDALLPIIWIFGLDNSELTSLIKKKNILLVEGESDIFLIKIIEILDCDFKNIINEWFICPLLGKDNLFLVDYLKKEKIKYKIFLDELPNSEMSDKNLFLLNEIFNSPEKMLSEETLNKYFLNEKSNHKIGWMKIYDDFYSKKFKFTDLEKDNLEKYKLFLVSNLNKNDK